MLTKKDRQQLVQDMKEVFPTKKDLDHLLGIEIIPTRIKCELLSLEILKRIK